MSEPRRGWDRGLDFDATRKSLTGAFEAEKARFQGQEGYQSRAVVYLGAALVQLVNGARASEAWDGYLSWLKHGLRNNQVRTRKRGSMLVCHMCAPSRSWSLRSEESVAEARKHSEANSHPLTEELIDIPREVLIPEELSDDDREPLQSLLTEHTTLSAYKVFLISKMGMGRDFSVGPGGEGRIRAGLHRGLHPGPHGLSHRRGPEEGEGVRRGDGDGGDRSV